MAIFSKFAHIGDKWSFMLWSIGLAFLYYKKLQHEKNGTRWQDSRLGAWLIENGACYFIAWINWQLTFTPQRPKTFLALWLHTFIGGMVTVDGLLCVLLMVSRDVYGHVPWFVARHKREQHASVLQVLFDYQSIMFPAQLISSGMASLAIGSMPEHAWKAGLARTYWRGRPVQVLGEFLLKLFIFRTVLDVVFYACHRLLHSKMLYSSLHKRHHEHVNPNVFTNWHFTVSDLIIEGYIPSFAGMQALNSLQSILGLPFLQVSHWDARLLNAYALWYELASHVGKPLPCVSMYPPLAPFYNSLYCAIVSHVEAKSEPDTPKGSTNQLDLLDSSSDSTSETDPLGESSEDTPTKQTTSDQPDQPALPKTSDGLRYNESFSSIGLHKKWVALQGLDTDNVWFHERHHNLFNCNYGITPWLDWFLGTFVCK